MVSFTRAMRGMVMTERLDFEIDVAPETGLITGHAGVHGLIEAFRQTPLQHIRRSPYQLSS